MATIYDVARQAGVSPSTVSRVLSGRRRVDPQLAERVQAAAKALSYRPNAVARNLRRSTSTLWAVVISDIENPFFTSLVRGVEDVAQSAGFSVVLCNSDEDPGKEADYLAAVQSEQMAGVIISPSGKPEALAALRESSTPMVLIDRRVPGITADTVLVDNEEGAAAATRHLLDVGYQRIACITGPRRASTAAERLGGFRRALRDAGMPFDRNLVRYADFREAGGREAMLSLLEQPQPPDAVFVANNLMTVGALECLAEKGIAVPTDVGVVAFDDIPWAALVRPSLTTVLQPTYELGRTAALLLIERLGAPGRPPSTVILPTELRVRQSSVRPLAAVPADGVAAGEG